MAHASIFAWAQVTVTMHGLEHRSVLECGSRGDSIRSMFDGRYVSLDTWLPPPGHVDLQASANALPFGNGTFDVCLATEMLEHDPAPQQSVAEMARVSRHHVLLTTRSEGYPYHSPPDYHRFSLEDMAVLVDEAGLGVVELVDDPECPGVFCLAAKP